METNNKQQKKKWFIPLVLSLLLSTLLILFSIFVSSDSSSLLYLYRTRGRVEEPRFVESKLRLSATSSSDSVPRIAYLISGSMGDGGTLKRTLKALYHPRNQYAVHLDLEASSQERLELANFVKNDPLFAEVGNVRMIVKANLVTYRGPTMVTNTLHAAAILLKEGGLWDWFINLSASDYPLITQDGTLFIFLSLDFVSVLISQCFSFCWFLCVLGKFCWFVICFQFCVNWFKCCFFVFECISEMWCENQMCILLVILLRVSEF